MSLSTVLLWWPPKCLLTPSKSASAPSSAFHKNFPPERPITWSTNSIHILAYSHSICLAVSSARKLTSTADGHQLAKTEEQFSVQLLPLWAANGRRDPPWATSSLDRMFCQGSSLTLPALQIPFVLFDRLEWACLCLPSSYLVIASAAKRHSLKGHMERRNLH